MTEISDLRDGMRKIDVEAVVSEISETREVNLRTGETARVAEATISNQSGEIKLSLWNDDIEKVTRGSTVKISNGYTNSFRGEVKLNVGKYGKLEVA